MGTVLADDARAAGRDEDAIEIEAVVEAMVRLLAGVPLRSEGKLTVKSLAAEAGLCRNKLTHNRTGVKDLFYALVHAQGERSQIVQDLHAANAKLADAVRALTAERDSMRADEPLLARVIHVLEVENGTVRKSVQTYEGVTDLMSKRRTAPPVIRTR